MKWHPEKEKKREKSDSKWFYIQISLSLWIHFCEPQTSAYVIISSMLSPGSTGDIFAYSQRYTEWDSWLHYMPINEYMLLGVPMEMGDAAHYSKVVETGKGKCGGGIISYL